MPLLDPARWPAGAQWATLVVGAIALALGMERLNVPAALLIGPIVWGAFLAMRGVRIGVPRPAHQFGQAIAGVLIALHIDPQILATTAKIWPAVLIFVLLTLLLACLVGLIAARLTGLDRDVAVWGFMPGMAGTMIALAHDRGLDSRMVAFIQILRLLMVIGAMAGVGAVLVGPAVPHHAAVPDPGAVWLIPTLLVAGLGIAAGRWLRMIPAGASLVPIMVGAVLQINGVGFAVPHWLVTIAYLCLGAQTGLRFTPEMLRVGARALPMLAASVVLLLVLCGISGVVLSMIASTDLMTAVLATVPGSIDSIALIAISTGSDMSFIMALQTVRLFAVVLFGPPMALATLHLATRLRTTPPGGMP